MGLLKSLNQLNDFLTAKESKKRPSYDYMFKLGTKEEDNSANVCFMYDDIKELMWCNVHTTVKTGTKKNGSPFTMYIDVPCIGEGCRHCATSEDDETTRMKKRSKIKIYIPLFNVDKEEIYIWAVSKKLFDTLKERIDDFEPFLENGILNQVFKITRSGTGLDTKYKLGWNKTIFEVPQNLYLTLPEIYDKIEPRDEEEENENY